MKAYEKMDTPSRRYYANHREERIESVNTYNALHPEHRQEYSKAYRAEHRKEISEYNKVNRERVRKDIMEHYGGARCACCGEDTYEFLSIDHINGDGAQHRRELRLHGGDSLYRWIIKNDYPDMFQVLCHNCNQAKGHYGKCPHETQKERMTNE